MRFKATGRVAAAAAAILLAAMSAPAARGADPMPGVADLQKLLADGKFKAAVAGASRLLAATGSSAPAGLDKAQVFAIKADAHLHLRQFSQAADAYTRSAKAASDPVVAATGTAMALLVKKSHNGTYVPRQPGSDGVKPSPVDIVSTDDHQAVLTDLFTDEFAADTAELTAGAKTATTVPQLQSAADLAALLRQLEVAAVGADVKTEPVVMAIASHATDVLNAALQPMSQQVDEIQTAANAPAPNFRRGQSRSMVTGANSGDPTANTGGGGGSGPKVGLTAQEQSDLQSIIYGAQRIAQAAGALAKTTDEPKGLSASASPAAGADTAAPADGATPDAGGGGGGGLAGVVAEANKIASKANDVLTAKYGGRSGRTYTPGASTGVRGTTTPPPQQ